MVMNRSSNAITDTPEQHPSGSMRATEEDDDVSAAREKGRVPTTVLRKRQIAELRAQEHAMQCHIAVLQRRQGKMVTSPHDELLKRLNLQGEALREIVDGYQLVVERAQLMLSKRLDDSRKNPMYSYIHLSSDWSARRECLLAMKDVKLARVHQFITARSTGMDLTKPHTSRQQFQGSDGSFNSVSFEVIQFEGVHSAQQVYDALVFYLYNMEISISERLGQTTVRDDYDSLDADAKISSHRLVSHTSHGITTEFNAVLFTQYLANKAEPGSEPCGLVATDAVDRDDLHPYRPNERLRKDVTAGIVLSPVYRPKRQTHAAAGDVDGEELVVVMRRAAWLRYPRPEFHIPEYVLQEIHEEIGAWGPIMVKTMQSILYPTS